MQLACLFPSVTVTFPSYFPRLTGRTLDGPVPANRPAPGLAGFHGYGRNGLSVG